MAEHIVFLCITFIAAVGSMYILKFVAISGGDETVTNEAVFVLGIAIWFGCVLMICIFMIGEHGAALGRIIGLQYFSEIVTIYPGAL